MYLHHDALLTSAFPDDGFPAIRGVTDRGQVRFESVDCLLGDHAYRMRSSALPRRNETVQKLFDSYSMYDFALSPDKDKVLEAGKPYIIPLRESLAPSLAHSVYFSPKSSTGRCFVFVRVLTDRNSFYDRAPEGYDGALYLEVMPLAFTISVRSLASLVQLRIRDQYDDRLRSDDVLREHGLEMRKRVGAGILFGKNKKPLPLESLEVRNGRLYFSLDLEREVIGFVAKQSCDRELNFGKEDHHNVEDFFDPLTQPKNGQLILEPGRFYLLCTKERIKIPPHLCGSVVDYETGMGEFRPHYASWFAPGFGGETGTPVVLEVRGADAPFRLVDGQPICCMGFDRIKDIPSLLLNSGSGAYDGSVSLSKHFKNRREVWKE